MGRPREFDEEQALRAALTCFWERGFEATSLADLTECMGLQRGSLYGAFGDKRRLFLTTLARYQDEGLEQMTATLGSDSSPRAALRAFLDGLVERATVADGTRGCLCVNSSVELAPHDEEVAERLRAHEKRVEALLQDVVERGQAGDEFSRSLEAHAAARFLATVLLGLGVLAKTRPGRECLDDVVRSAMRVLEP